MAFYAEPSPKLRFGDVVTGFQLAALRIDTPGGTQSLDLNIRLTHTQYFVVMTPCCSIEMQSISLAPLEDVRLIFLSTPQLWDDLTRINSPMPAEQAVPPKKWENLDATQKSKIIAQGTSYVFVECFIYEPHALFQAYALRKGRDARDDVRHRMVDFKKIFRVDCAQIDRNLDAPAGIKVLQISNTVRAQLRDKLAYFFGRPPEEDML